MIQNVLLSNETAAQNGRSDSTARMLTLIESILAVLIFAIMVKKLIKTFQDEGNYLPSRQEKNVLAPCFVIFFCLFFIKKES